MKQNYITKNTVVMTTTQRVVNDNTNIVQNTSNNAPCAINILDKKARRRPVSKLIAAFILMNGVGYTDQYYEGVSSNVISITRGCGVGPCTGLKSRPRPGPQT